MADRTVTTRLRLAVSDWQAGSSTVKRDLKDLNRQFTESAGFAKGFRKQMEDATKRLPKIEIDLNSSPAEVKLAVVRDELEKLSRKEIGVDVDAGAALTEMSMLQTELASLEDDASFEVRASIQQAMKDLAAVEVEARRLDGRRVKLDVDTGLLSRAASTIGPMFDQAFGVIGKAGPAQVAIAAAAIAGLPAVAGVAAAGITLSLGSALVTLGLTGAAQADVVQDRWQALGQSLKRELADAAEPLAGSAVKAADVAEKAFARLKPTLKRTFSDLAPDVNQFVETWADGIASLGPAMNQLGRGFASILDELSNASPEIFSNLDSAITTLANTATEHADDFAGLVVAMTEVVDKGADVTATLADVWDGITSVQGAAQAGGFDPFVGPLNALQYDGSLVADAMNKVNSAILDVASASADASGGVINLKQALEEFYSPAAKCPCTN